MTDPFSQEGFEIRFDWGLEGLKSLLPSSDVIIIVDVLSFSTCVSIAVTRGAHVLPCRWKDERAGAFAKEKKALLASPRGGQGPSLSPASLRILRAGDRFVLPSPNGSELSLGTGSIPTLAGCLRNASATAKAASSLGRRASVIAAGEQWAQSGLLRPALEDFFGAGAIISAMGGQKSPEALAAQAAYLASKIDLLARLGTCASGQELKQRGFSEDVSLAADFDAERIASILRSEGYTAFD